MGYKTRSTSYAPCFTCICKFYVIHPYIPYASKLLLRSLIKRKIGRRRNTVITEGNKVNTLLLAHIFKLGSVIPEYQYMYIKINGSTLEIYDRV